MTPAPPTTSVLDEVATWPGVSTQPTPRGATAIVLDGHELGHVHADRRRSICLSPATDASECSPQGGRRSGSPAG
jgi:hypothetical protein